LQAFRRDPLEFLTHCAHTYGDVALFRIFKVPVFLISRPEYIEIVLSTRARNFVKGRSMRAAGPLLGEGLFLAEGSSWVRLRQLNQPGFRRDRIAEFAQTTIECTQRMIGRWRDGDIVDIHAAMNELTVQIVARAMLGIDVESDTAEIGACLHTILEHFRAQLDSGLMIPPSFPTPRNLRTKEALKRFETVVARIISAKSDGSTFLFSASGGWRSPDDRQRTA
jgi:cytochrome P450